MSRCSCSWRSRRCDSSPAARSHSAPITVSHSALDVAFGVDDATIPAAQLGSGVPSNAHVPVVPFGSFANSFLQSAMGEAQPFVVRFDGALNRARTHDFDEL